MFKFSKNDLSLMEDGDVIALFVDDVPVNASQFDLAYNKLPDEYKGVVESVADTLESRQSDRIQYMWGVLEKASSILQSDDYLWCRVDDTLLKYQAVRVSEILDFGITEYYRFL